MHVRQFSALVAATVAIIGSATASWQRPNDVPPRFAVQSSGMSVNQESTHLGTQSKIQSKTLRDMLDTLETMQDSYFDTYGGTWPDTIDWTGAVMGTHVSATLSSLILGLDMSEYTPADTCTELLAWDNLVNKYYLQTSIYYFGENAFAIRNQAYDDMLWVVLGWLENIKFAELYSRKRWNRGDPSKNWHGLQTIPNAAHRARIFYELASDGWDTSLCGGGMNWNPALDPYKNAITNELFAAASIGMYLYYPGDNNTSPFVANGVGSTKPHDPQHLENAVKTYKWLKDSGIESTQGLFQDGFHVTGWHKFRNGTIDTGTKICDDLNVMVYTYNQGVILSAVRGLWIATGARSYLDDGHALVSSVIHATGWPNGDKLWRGLGRNGVLEEFCDHQGYCSQDGQTFKGIFFSHLSEFCRPLWPQEEEFISLSLSEAGFDKQVYKYHLDRCAAYGKWVKHNAQAALMTRDDDGLFGMWWGVSPDSRWTAEDLARYPQQLPQGAVDHLNPKSSPIYDADDLNERGRGRTIETQSGGLAVLRAHWQWESCFS